MTAPLDTDLRITRARVAAIREWLASGPSTTRMTLSVERNGRITEDMGIPLHVASSDTWRQAILCVACAYEGLLDDGAYIAMEIDRERFNQGDHGRMIYAVDSIAIHPDRLIITGRGYDATPATIAMRIIEHAENSCRSVKDTRFVESCDYDGPIPAMIRQTRCTQMTLEAWA